MKRTLSILCTALAVSMGSQLAVAQNALRPAVTQPQVDKPMRILFIGNSLMYYNGGLQTHTHRLGAADKSPLKLEPGFKSVHITGATLDQYPLEYLIKPEHIGKKDPFQVVLLAGNSLDATSEQRTAAYRKKVIEFDKIIKENGAKTVLYWLPSMVKPHRMADTDILHMNEKMYLSIANEIGAMVIPVGPAYAEAYRQRPDIKLQVYDGNHPTIAGQYLSACVLYASLYNRSPVGNSYNYFGAIDDDTKTFLQKVALDTVNKFYGRNIQ